MTLESDVEVDRAPVLRPGAELFEVDEAKLYVSLPNHTVTFTGVAVVRGVRALIAEMARTSADDSLIDRAAACAGLKPGFVAYLLNLLQSSQCLYWSEPSSTAVGDAALARYFASVGETPHENMRLLEQAALAVVAAEEHAAALRAALDSAGLASEVHGFASGTSVEEVEHALAAKPDQATTAIVAWGFPYESPVARVINRTAARGVPALFGTCEGQIGRIGPYFIPGSTPCLECLTSRLLSNAGQDELRRWEAYRLRHAHAVPECRPVHPALRTALASLFVLEIEDIVLARPPRTLGGILELSLAERTLQRRPVLKAPRCDACSAAVPPRFAWDVRFDSPMVKGGRAER